MKASSKVLVPVGLTLGLWAILLLVGAAGGADDPWQPLKVYSAARAEQGGTAQDAFITVTEPGALQTELDAAKASDRWVLIDYYADWCVSCKIMEKQVFAKSEVLNAMQGVQLLRLDVTADSQASRALLERYKVPGPPSLLWIGPDGSERRDRRITGQVDADTFLQQWQATRERG